MRIEVTLILVLFGVVIILVLYMFIVRNRLPRSKGKNQAAERESGDTMLSDTSAQSQETDTVRQECETQSVDLAEAETSETWSVIGKDSLVKNTHIQGWEHPPTLDSVKEKKSPAENSGTSDTNTGSKAWTQAGAVEDLGEKEDKRAQQGTYISPGGYGGPPRTGTREEKIDSAFGPRERDPKLEVVCWKREREWVLGVEIPEELSNMAEIWVSQNRTRLTEDTLYKGCYLFRAIGGQIGVFTSDGEVKIDIRESNYLVYKLSGADLTQGRHVMRPCTGLYLVIVPEDWERDEEFAGIAPATPEPVCLDGYRAHFFDLVANDSSKIAFIDRMGNPIVVASGGPQFVIVGHELHDASEHLGPLFGQSAPRISIANGRWQDVGTIVVGEEGSGSGRWRESLSPNLDLEEQQLPDKIPNIAVGWYFVRLYNLRDELIDSIDFRFVAGLRQITVDSKQPFPSEVGHTEATVEFEHDSSYHLEPEGVFPETLAVNRNNEKTTVIIPPNVTYDRTTWLVGLPDSPRVRIEILVERIWWAFGKVKEPPSQWQDKCLFLSCDDFKAASESAIWLRLPRCRYTDCVTVGFQRAKSREFTLKVVENTLAIPLRDFSDSQEISVRTITHSLTVWLKVNDNEYECVVVRIRAENAQRNIGVTHTLCKLEPLPITWKVKRYIVQLLGKPQFIPNLKSALNRLERIAPDHCRVEIVKWSEELGKQNPDFKLIWISFCAVDKYLRPKPNCTNLIPMPIAALRDILKTEKKLEQWWSGS